MKLTDINSILLHSITLKPRPHNLVLFSVTLSHICLVSFKLFFLYEAHIPIHTLLYTCMNRILCTSQILLMTQCSLFFFFSTCVASSLLVNNASGLSSCQLVFNTIWVHYLNSCLVFHKGLCYTADDLS